MCPRELGSSAASRVSTSESSWYFHCFCQGSQALTATSARNARVHRVWRTWKNALCNTEERKICGRREELTDGGTQTRRPPAGAAWKNVPVDPEKKEHTYQKGLLVTNRAQIEKQSLAAITQQGRLPNCTSGSGQRNCRPALASCPPRQSSQRHSWNPGSTNRADTCPPSWSCAAAHLAAHLAASSLIRGLILTNQDCFLNQWRCKDLETSFT